MRVTNEMVEAHCRYLCKSGKFETGQGTCATLCMDQLGDARRSCSHVVQIFGEFSRAGLEAALAAMPQVEGLEAEAVKDGLVIHRYEHGGARIFIERDGRRDLVMDLYDTEDAQRREAIIAAALRAGAIRSRKGGENG